MYFAPHEPLRIHGAYSFGLFSHAHHYASTIRAIATEHIGPVGPLLRALYERVIRLEELALAAPEKRPNIAVAMDISHA
ncbi:MAG: hypothetical protein AB7J35_21130 [Dehalococcoidia bacterium]